jgi:hypothetical protein
MRLRTQSLNGLGTKFRAVGGHSAAITWLAACHRITPPLQKRVVHRKLGKPARIDGVDSFLRSILTARLHDWATVLKRKYDTNALAAQRDCNSCQQPEALRHQEGAYCHSEQALVANQHRLNGEQYRGAKFAPALMVAGAGHGDCPLERCRGCFHARSFRRCSHRAQAVGPRSHRGSSFNHRHSACHNPTVWANCTEQPA